MDVSALLTDLYSRIPPLAREAVADLRADQLCRAPAPGANTIGWLVWHLARVQDHQIAEMFDCDQIWVSDGWAERFGMEPDPSNMGYGHTAPEAAAVRPDGPEVLVDYLDAVDIRTQGILGGLTATDLDRVIDRTYDPPVTVGVRLISIADDCLQHAGQANYLRGVYGW
jgi:hypothetical protein